MYRNRHAQQNSIKKDVTNCTEQLGIRIYKGNIKNIFVHTDDFGKINVNFIEAHCPRNVASWKRKRSLLHMTIRLGWCLVYNQ